MPKVLLNKQHRSDQSGYSVSSAGDVNGDGFDDVIIGAPFASDGNMSPEVGESYVVFGSDSPFPASLDLSSLDGSNGFLITGLNPEGIDEPIISVSGAGDVNNDGFDDIIIGTDQDQESYVVFGFSTASNDTIGEAIATGLSSEQPGTFSLASAIGDDSNFTPENNDVDLLEFQLDAGDGVIIDIDADELGSSLDPILRLFDSNGNEVAVSDDNPAPGEGFTLDSYIEFIAPSSDSYYVGVSSFSNFSYDPFVANSGSFGGSTGDYEIEIEVIAEGSINGTDDSDELVGTEENDTINGFEGEDTVAGNAGDDLIDGGDGDDVLRGDFNSRSPQVGVGGNDTIIGGAGNDRIGGKGGDDELFGSEGDDSIWGDDGDDLINGGLGDDLLTGDDFSGGSGSDTFILAVGEGTDTITDFELGIDQIDLEGLTFEDLSISTMGNQTEIAFGDETLAILQGVTETLTESDFV